jgi:hypothetical protein
MSQQSTRENIVAALLADLEEAQGALTTMRLVMLSAAAKLEELGNEEPLIVARVLRETAAAKTGKKEQS